MINELKETHNQNVDQQNGFHHMLDEMAIPYRESEIHLEVGEMPQVSGWVLFLSANINHIADLISIVCPILYEGGLSFSVVKDVKNGAMKNDFWYGIHEVGKIITVFTIEEKITKQLIDKLTVITNHFVGPAVNNAIRIGEILYVSQIVFVDHQKEGGQMEKMAIISDPGIKRIPFRIERKYQYWKRKRLLKWRYVPLVMINRSPKGDLLKSVDIKWFAFSWCFIKEGKYHVFNDNHGRFLKDRLQWQAKVLQDLHGHVPVPKFIDYFEQGEESYLVMEWLDGKDLHGKIEEIYQRRKWKDLDTEEQRELINYYLNGLSVIEKIHSRGYVHRDATASNFMVLQSGEMYTIDLELAYNIRVDEPNPPFAMGAFGYVSPEQVALQKPTVKEDIYTIGALLLHTITGIHPGTFVNEENHLNMAEVEKHIQIPALRDIIFQCLDVDPGKRPDLGDIREGVKKIFC